MSNVMRMADRWVRAIAIEKGRLEFADAVIRGLRLRVSPRVKSWSVLTRASGRQQRIAIGEFPDITLADARERADTLLTAMPSPTAPAGAEKDASSTPIEVGAPTLRQLCQDYVARMRTREQPAAKTYEQGLIESADSLCKHLEAKLGRTVLALEVTEEHMVSWLRAAYLRSPAHARHLRGYAHAVFEWALKARYDFTTPGSVRGYGVTSNPVRSTPAGPGVRARNRVLSGEEISALWRLLPDVARPRIVTAMRMVIAMGGLRVSEITWSKKSYYRDGCPSAPAQLRARAPALPSVSRTSSGFIAGSPLLTSPAP